MKPIRFAQSARRHRIGKAHVYYVVVTAPHEAGIDMVTKDPTLTWEAPDDRGLTLRIVLVEKHDCFLVVHVQPAYSKGERP